MHNGVVTNKPVYDIDSVFNSIEKNYENIMTIMERAYELANRDQDELSSHSKEWEDRIEEYILEIDQDIRKLAATEVKYTEDEIRQIVDSGYYPEPHYNEEIMEFLSWLPGKPNLCYPTDEEIGDLKEKLKTIEEFFHSLRKTVAKVWGI